MSKASRSSNGRPTLACDLIADDQIEIPPRFHGRAKVVSVESVSARIMSATSQLVLTVRSLDGPFKGHEGQLMVESNFKFDAWLAPRPNAMTKFWSWIMTKLGVLPSQTDRAKVILIEGKK